VGFSTTDRRVRQRAPWALKTIGTVVGLLFAFPAAYLIWRNVTTDGGETFTDVVDRTRGPLWRTIRLAILVGASTAVLGTLLAWLTTRTDLPGRRLWRVLLPLPLVYPTFVGAAAFIRTLNPGGLVADLVARIGIHDTPELRGLFGAWLVLTLFTYPYVYLPVAARLRGLPASLEENARLLGSSTWSTFRRIVLPQTASAISTGTLLVVLYAISDFGAVQLMRYDTLTRAVWTTRLNNQPLSFALAAILLVLAVAVVVAQRVMSRRLAEPGRAGSGRKLILPLGRWRPAALATTFVVVVLGLAVPAASLADWAISGIRREATGGRELFISADDLLRPAWNTAWISVVTALVAIVFVLPIAYLVGRYRSRLGSMANAVITATFAMPGLLIALSMFFWTLRNPWAAEHLRGSVVVLVFAYMVRFGAQAVGAATVAVAAVPPRLQDASRILGAGKIRRFATVDLPIMTPGLLAGAGLVLLSTMKELPISLLVAPFDFPTLSTKIFLSFEDAFVAEAGILALVLVGISAILTWLLVVRRADHLD